MQSVRFHHLVVIPMLALATTAGAQSQDDSIVDLATQAAARLAVLQTPGTGPRADVTLDDAIARALERNLDIAVQRLNPQIVDLRLAGQLAAYRHGDFWHCMDTLRDVRYLEKLWAQGDAPWKVWDE